MSDCIGCDPDLTYHMDECPLAGELRGKLWLPKPEPVDWEQRATDALTDLAHIAQVLGQDDLTDGEKCEAITQIVKARTT